MISWFINQLSPPDTREPYFTDLDGQALAFVVTGEDGNTPNHEDFTHGVDGTEEALGHQDPVVINRTVWRASWQTFFIPQPVTIQERYYPYTVKQDGTIPDLVQVEARVSVQAEQLRRRRQQAYHAPMPRWMERRAWNQETNKQRGRGVPGFRLIDRSNSRVQNIESAQSFTSGRSRVSGLTEQKPAAASAPARSKTAQREAKRPARAKRAARAVRRR